MRRFKGTFIAAVVVTALVAYAYFFEYKKKNEDEAQKQKDQIVMKFDADKIKLVELSTMQGMVTLDKADGIWKITTPIIDQADAATVNNLLTSMGTERSEDVVAEGESVAWATYGLDRPSSVIILTSEDGKKHVVKLGSVKSFDGKLYARVGEESRVLLLGSNWESMAGKPVKELRNRKVFRSDSTQDITHISIERMKAGKKIPLELDLENGSWRVKGDDSGFPVSHESVQAMLEQVKGLRIQEFLTEGQSPADLRKHGLMPPYLQVELGKGEQIWKMSIAAPPPVKKEDKKKKVEGEDLPANPDVALIAIVSSDLPGLAQVYRSSFKLLEKEIEDFYDRKYPFAFDISQVSRVKVKTLHMNLDVQKKGSNWELSDTSRRIDSAKFDDLISRVGKFEVGRFVAFSKGSEKAQGLAPPKNQLVFWNDKGETVFEMVWGGTFTGRVGGATSDSKIYYTKTSRVDRVFGLQESAVEGLPWKEVIVDKAAEGAAQNLSSGPASAATPAEKNSN